MKPSGRRMAPAGIVIKQVKQRERHAVPAAVSARLVRGYQARCPRTPTGADAPLPEIAGVETEPRRRSTARYREIEMLRRHDQQDGEPLEV